MSKRNLTPEEIAEAKKVFGDHIDYAKVNIINAKYLFFQPKSIIIAPNGNIYWPDEPGNLVKSGTLIAGVFIHEMTHVMQYQKGMNVLLKGFFLQAAKFLSLRFYNPYKFDYDSNRAFSSYNMEQQGDYAREIYFGKLPNTIIG